MSRRGRRVLRCAHLVVNHTGKQADIPDCSKQLRKMCAAFDASGCNPVVTPRTMETIVLDSGDDEAGVRESDDDDDDDFRVVPSRPAVPR